MKPKISLVVVISLVVGVVAGYLISNLAEVSGPVSQTDTRQIKRGFVKELRSEGFIPPAPEEIREVSGAIEQVGENSIEVTTQQKMSDPLRELVPETITVNVTDQTEIVKLEEKSSEVLQREQEQYNEKMQQYQESDQEEPADLTPPQLFSEKKINFSELNKGQSVTVETEQDVTGKSEFKAATIRVQSKM